MGKTVQVVPHVTDAIQDWIERVAAIPVDESGLTPDVCIVEVIFLHHSFNSSVELWVTLNLHLLSKHFVNSSSVWVTTIFVSFMCL